MADGLQDAPRHAGQVVRRVLLRRNIAIDAETAQLVAGTPCRPRSQADTAGSPGRHLALAVAPRPSGYPGRPAVSMFTSRRR